MRCIHDKIGPSTLLGIGHLLGENRFEPLNRHAGTLKDPRPLHIRRGRNNRDGINAFVAAVRSRSTPAVSADDGLRVMELSERIKAVMLTDSVAP